MIDTKEFIVDQAYGLFLTKSYEAVSINDISKAIGLTKGALYHHFKNKEELFKAVIDKFLRVLTLTGLEPDISLEEFIGKHVEHARNIVDAIHSEPAPFIPVNYLSLIIDAFRHYPGYETQNEKLLGQEIIMIREVLNRAVANGEIRNDIDTQVMALNFLGISLGIAVNLLHRSLPSAAIEIYRQQLNEFYKLLKK